MIAAVAHMDANVMDRIAAVAHMIEAVSHMIAATAHRIAAMAHMDARTHGGLQATLAHMDEALPRFRI